MSLLYGFLVLLGTWLLNMFFRKWFDLYLWPKIGDWWASRSKATLLRRIEKRKNLLDEAEALTILTEFEAYVLRCLGFVINVLAAFGLAAFAMLFPLKGQYLDAFHFSVFALFFSVLVSSTVAGGRINRFQLMRSREFRERTRHEIDTLSQKLAGFGSRRSPL
jgi:hypothetical protein